MKRLIMAPLEVDTSEDGLWCGKCRALKEVRCNLDYEKVCTIWGYLRNNNDRRWQQCIDAEVGE